MDNALSLIQNCINKSPYKVTVINRINHESKCDELLGITEHSALGTIVNYVGGISIENNLIRHYGGENQYGLSIREINRVEEKLPTAFKNALVVADDMYGGIFAINIGLSKFKVGSIIYLPPDSYTWEDLNIGHSDFLEWSLLGDINLFYKSIKDKVVTSNPSFDETWSFIPSLWIEAEKYNPQKIKTKKMHKIRSQMLEIYNG